MHCHFARLYIKQEGATFQPQVHYKYIIPYALKIIAELRRALIAIDWKPMDSGKFGCDGNVHLTLVGASHTCNPG